MLDKRNFLCYNIQAIADVAHPVERHLAKVEVASSSLVIRSKQKSRKLTVRLFLFAFTFTMQKFNIETRCFQLKLKPKTPCYFYLLLHIGTAFDVCSEKL